MTEKFKNKFRISSARMKGYNYGLEGIYFITFCTKSMKHFFGEVANGDMHLNDAGRIADQLWMEIPVHFPFVQLGCYIVMPNHVHGIIIINKQKSNFDFENPGKTGGITGTVNPMIQQNIPHVIRWFKGRCSFQIRKSNKSFMWQSRYYDIIIRDAKSFDLIQFYIENNPHNWTRDKFNMGNSCNDHSETR